MKSKWMQGRASVEIFGPEELKKVEKEFNYRDVNIHKRKHP
jgi:hypothetical protein